MIFSYNHKRFESLLGLVAGTTKIVKIIMFVVLAVLLIGIGVTLFLPESLLTFDFSRIDTLSIEWMSVNLSVPNTVFEGEFMVKGSAILALFLAMFIIGFTILIVHLLERILKDVQDKRPFSENNVQRLFRMAVSFIVAGFLMPIVTLIASHHVIKTFDLDARANYDIQFEWIFIGLLIYLLASIFQYGKHLQDEVDHTV